MSSGEIWRTKAMKQRHAQDYKRRRRGCCKARGFDECQSGALELTGVGSPRARSLGQAEIGTRRIRGIGINNRSKPYYVCKA